MSSVGALAMSYMLFRQTTNLGGAGKLQHDCLQQATHEPIIVNMQVFAVV